MFNDADYNKPTPPGVEIEKWEINIRKRKGDSDYRKREMTRNDEFKRSCWNRIHRKHEMQDNKLER